jgi:hypothetical protein
VHPLCSFVHQCQRLGYHIQPFLYLSRFGVRCGQLRKMTYPHQFCPHGSEGSQALLHLRQAFAYLPLLGQRFTSNYSPLRQPEGKSLLG